jgi:hypothetical protein
MENSDDFVFDNEMLAQAIYFGYRIGELSCPTKYLPEASSINFRRSVTYGLGVLWTSVRFRLQRWHVWKFRLFLPEGRGLARLEHSEAYYSRISSNDTANAE